MAATVVHLDGEKVGINEDGKFVKDTDVLVTNKSVDIARKGTLNGDSIARSELQPGDEIQSYGPDQFIATRK